MTAPSTRPLPLDWEARCRALTQRDADRAAELAKAHASIDGWKKAAKKERDLRLEAERNARQWHALLLQERVRRLPDKDRKQDD